MGVDEDIHATASERRRLVANALSYQLDPSAPGSAASQMQVLLDEQRSMIVSADIDGLVTAAMLAAVAPNWKIAGFVKSSAYIVAPPSLSGLPPDGGHEKLPGDGHETARWRP